MVFIRYSFILNNILKYFIMDISMERREYCIEGKLRILEEDRF